uniref:Microtubule-associated protein 9 n=1 Tax=Mesocestoides corti TaxID=53468 RepID=A0A5K3F7X9_MESCO
MDGVTLDSLFQSENDPFGLFTNVRPSRRTKVKVNGDDSGGCDASENIDYLGGSLFEKDNDSKIGLNSIQLPDGPKSMADDAHSVEEHIDVDITKGLNEQQTFMDLLVNSLSETNLNLTRDLPNVHLDTKGIIPDISQEDGLSFNAAPDTIQDTSISPLQFSPGYRPEDSFQGYLEYKTDIQEAKIFEEIPTPEKKLNIQTSNLTGNIMSSELDANANDVLGAKNMELSSRNQIFSDNSTVGNKGTAVAVQPRNPSTKSVMVSGAIRGNKRVTEMVPQTSRSMASPPTPSNNSRTGTKVAGSDSQAVQVKSSMDLRNLTYHNWCAKRDQKCTQEKRQQKERLAAQEAEVNRQKEERLRQNQRVFSMWMAKKREQEAAKQKQQLQDAKQKQEEEENKRKHKAEAAKAFEAWKTTKSKQVERRSSACGTDRGTTDEERKRKSEKEAEAKAAFEAWQRQKNQMAAEAKQKEAQKARLEKRKKLEEEARRKERAKASYAQWEAQKVWRREIPRLVISMFRLQCITTTVVDGP